MDLHKIGIKFFAEDAAPSNMVDLIPVFHRWIQTAAIEDLLIDVADYSHVHDGPGVMIIAHEGNYAYDETGGRRGFVYYSKHPLDGELPERLRAVTRKVLKACKRFEAESEIEGVSFPGNELEIFANDRLMAPNTEETFVALEPALRGFLEKLYPQGYTLARETDPRERFSVRVKAAEPAPVDVLLERATV